MATFKLSQFKGLTPGTRAFDKLEAAAAEDLRMINRFARMDILPPEFTEVRWRTFMGDIIISEADVIDGDFTVVETDPTKLIE